MRQMIFSLMRRHLKCPNCNMVTRTVERRRMNTAYHKDESNYITCCLLCFFEVWEYYKERWEDYYASIMC